MKLSGAFYGHPKQLYQTSYAPLDSSRSSSLNNSNFVHSSHHQNQINRPENPLPVLLVREISRSNLSGSQLSQQQFKSKGPSQEYYPETNKVDESIKQIQQKIEQINRKVNKNAQQINTLKSKEATACLLLQKKVGSQLQKINEKQQSQQNYCRVLIGSVKQELLGLTGKFGRLQLQIFDKINLKSDEKLLMRVKNLVQERVKQETTKIRLIIDNQNNKLTHQLRWELKRDQLDINPIKSKLKYPFKSVKLTYSQFIQIGRKDKDKGRQNTRESSQSPRSVKMGNEKIYFVDQDGYLLDQDNFYLLDEFQKMIRLSEQMLQKLRREGVLKD